MKLKKDKLSSKDLLKKLKKISYRQKIISADIINEEIDERKTSNNHISFSKFQTFFMLLSIILSFGVGIFMIIDDSYGVVRTFGSKGSGGRTTIVTGPGFIAISVFLICFFLYIKILLNKEGKNKL